MADVEPTPAPRRGAVVEAPRGMVVTEPSAMAPGTVEDPAATASSLAASGTRGTALVARSRLRASAERLGSLPPAAQEVASRAAAAAIAQAAIT
ncbi:MAG TPA: hypothetical protein VNA57_12215 [Acidimicrobiales bacterium]|nr:hypothetical protein [Acidimicrobiales bacterium]